MTNWELEHLHDLPVVSNDPAQRVGRVDDVLFHPAQSALSRLVVRPEAMKARRLFIPLADIRPIGRVPGQLRVTHAIRLSPDEYREFNTVAKARGITLADLFRSSVHVAIAGDLDVDKAAAAAEVKEKARELVEVAARL